MAQRSNITLTGVSGSQRVFKPVSQRGNDNTNNNTIVFADRTTETFIGGEATLSISFDPAGPKRSTDRIGFTLAIPKCVTNANTGVREVLSIARYTGGKYIFPSDWTSTERGEFHSLCQSVTGSNEFVQMVLNREEIW